MKRYDGKKIIVAALLCGAMMFGTIHATEPVKGKETMPSVTESEMHPESVLYVGEVKSFDKSENGKINRILMNSKEHGETLMKIGDETVWIDNSTKSAFLPAELKIGETLYVYHSPVSTRSLPPQTLAFAFVRKVDKKEGLACLLTLDTVKQNEKDKGLSVWAKGDTMTYHISETAKLMPYLTKNLVHLSDIQKGERVMVWHTAPEKNNVHITDLVLLPKVYHEVSRGKMVEMLYEMEKEPKTEGKVRFTDVEKDGKLADAVAWATAHQIVKGYNETTFAPYDLLNREQAAVILLRYASYKGYKAVNMRENLIAFTDVDKISSYAVFSVNWAVGAGVMKAENNQIHPHGQVMENELPEMIEKSRNQK